MPTAALPEGFVKHLHATFRQGSQVSGSSSLFALGWQALQTHALVLTSFLWEGLSFALPGLLVFPPVLRVAPRRKWSSAPLAPPLGRPSPHSSPST